MPRRMHANKGFDIYNLPVRDMLKAQKIALNE
jgi:hypothetical protein